MNEGYWIEGTTWWRSCAGGLRSWWERNMSGSLDLEGEQIGWLSGGGGVRTITPGGGLAQEVMVSIGRSSGGKW